MAEAQKTPARGPNGLIDSVFQAPKLPNMDPFVYMGGAMPGKETVGRLLSSIFQLPTLPSLNPIGGYMGDSKAMPTQDAEQAPDEVPPVPSRAPGMEQKRIKDAAEKPPVATDVGAGGAMGQFGAALDPTAAAQQNVTLPSSFVDNGTALKAGLLQGALSLMTPSWGNSMSQLGQAVGQGAEAYTRAKNSGHKDVARELGVQKTLADIEGEKALSTARVEATETSKEKRLKDKTDRSTEFERMVAGVGLGPKGSAYLKTRLKSFDDILGEDAELDPATRFTKIVEEARALDAKDPKGAVAPTAKAPTGKAPPKKNDMVNGYMFKGGDPAKPENWEKVN